MRRMRARSVLPFIESSNVHGCVVGEWPFVCTRIGLDVHRRYFWVRGHRGEARAHERRKVGQSYGGKWLD